MKITDFHNHLVPGVDDGARDATQARTAVQSMRSAGVGAIIATPHFNASLTHDPLLLAGRLAELDAGWAQLAAAAAGVDVQLHRGAEVALDMPQPDLSDARLRLAGGRFVLVEFAFMTVPPHSPAVLAALRSDGWAPILAHPERYGQGSEVELARSWKAAGALLQVNGGSLTGRYGAGPQKAAVQLLEAGLADYVCSDYHARGEPGVPAYRAALEELGAGEHAELLMEHNPSRVLQQQDPIPVPPLRLRPGGILERVRRLLG